MRLPVEPLAAILILVLWPPAVLRGQPAAGDSSGYFMLAKVTRVDSEGRIDVWPTSVRSFPRQLSEPAETDAPRELPRVIATLELKQRSVASRVRSSDLHGERVSLRGECEDLEKATRVPVIQLRIGAGERWHQVYLEPANRRGADGFRQIAARVCGAGSADESAPVSPERDPG